MDNPNFVSSTADIRLSTSQDSSDFTNVTLRDPDAETRERKPKKAPRRILHFSDGILEEYSTDEEIDPDPVPQVATVDPKKLDWLPWFWYKLGCVASGSLHYADFCGEKLAWFFGITSPKYQSAIDEYERMKAEEEEERLEQEQAARIMHGQVSRVEEGLVNDTQMPRNANPFEEEFEDPRSVQKF